MPAQMPAQPLMPLIPPTPAMREPPEEPTVPAFPTFASTPPETDLPPEFVSRNFPSDWPEPEDTWP